jgi:hypothetical protein
MGKYKYLGRRVRDIGRKGLSNKSEFINIARLIVEDYRKGRISFRTADGRLLLLYRLTYKKNNSNLDLSPRATEEVRRYIESKRAELRMIKARKKG